MCSFLLSLHYRLTTKLVVSVLKSSLSVSVLKTLICDYVSSVMLKHTARFWNLTNATLHLKHKEHTVFQINRCTEQTFRHIFSPTNLSHYGLIPIISETTGRFGQKALLESSLDLRAEDSSDSLHLFWRHSCQSSSLQLTQI